MTKNKLQTAGQGFFLTAAPLFLVLFIDSMGLGLVFPIMNALVVDPNAHFVAGEINSSTRNILFGMTIAVYMFCWFFGAAILGDLSDQMGRKKALMICLIGAVFGYILSALAVIFQSFPLLITGRVIAGFTAGSQSIAQAAIVDISSSEHKARNLGWMLFIISLGFVFGPLAGGVLSNAELSASFNYATPFYFAALISLLNAVLLQLFFKETFTRTGKLRFKMSRSLEIFVSAFTHEKVRELSVILLIMIFGWSSFYSFIPMFLLQVYHFNSMQTGVYMGVMGAGFGIGTGLLVDRCTRYFSLKSCMMGGALIAAVASALTLAAPGIQFVWIYIVPLSIAMAIAYSTLLTLFSNQVDEKSQGWVMGITGSIMAFAFGFNGILVGLLANLDIRLPLVLSGSGLALSALLMKWLYKGGNENSLSIENT